MNFQQTDFEVRCEWGKQGVVQLAPASDVMIVVDVLSFSTCIEIANSRGAIVFPYQWKDDSAKAYARSVGARLAEKRGSSGYSLSPASLMSITQGTRLVLPSPNGSSLSLATTTVPILTGCLRNCKAVALAAMNYGRKITVIPAGEQWSDRSLRPSFEDFIGAGAIISYLEGSLSPEAQLAVTAYRGIHKTLEPLIKQCGSGKELIERGFEQDVDLAANFNVSDCVPNISRWSI
ncbi:putative lipoprotein [Hyella patelloides LEGE 07179]|uniref:Probable 2-phosphosulfolactate phosphatase n=1 Tax=Hyella patelloides LEGE 07179 TaxID=945734 RepID=A0A563VTC6_9CYAN|nr:2-phosphosulfolactate phosphatase [Hyella patelloides]VEP14521.1 putative lipoprotein [Hyella patelloides LEGE 07179]